MPSPARGCVLLVEDDAGSAELLRELLEAEAFQVQTYRTGGDALQAARQDAPVAVFLDWVLPDRPGIELCREFRQHDALVPILFVSGRDDEASAVRAFEAGADDFIVKPYRHAELVARLEARLRRRAALGDAPPGDAPASVQRFGEVEVDLEGREVTVAGEAVRLGALEFQLLAYLVGNPGVAVSRDQVLEHVYGYEQDIPTDRVDLLVRRLRAKLGPGPRRGGLIVAVPGYGFRLERRGRS